MTYQYHHQSGADCVCTHGSQEHLNRGTCLHSDKDTTWCACEEYKELHHNHPTRVVKARGVCPACDHYHARQQDKAEKDKARRKQRANMWRSQSMMGNQNARRK